MQRSSVAVLLSTLLAGCGLLGDGAAPPAPSSADWDETLADTRRLQGLLVLHADDDRGRLLLELPAPAGPNGECLRLLWVAGLRTGIGSNPLGLDRGQLGDARLVVFRRLGPTVLLEQPNLRFRAQGDAAARRATEESFATSVLWGSPALAVHEDGRALVDLTGLLLGDAHDVARALADAGEGEFAPDPARSALDLPALLVFPDNVEAEALLTFAGRDPGPHLAATVPRPDAVSLVLHHSFVRLPPPGYEPLPLDPRAGALGLLVHDTTAPLAAPVEQRLALRHRLELRDPTNPSAGVVEPIVYHVDRGAPPEVQQALLDGARWWADAFEAAGLPGAFRVELLPEDAHPLDVRFNVVQWVHRSTRGWSYGHAVTDPRTGEIVKGHVSLGSLRVRQDRLLFEGLLGTSKTGSGEPDDPLVVALARIRQLAAHEVGHTLGLSHNFAASVVRNGSVMDYPAPAIALAADGGLDLRAAYGTGIGPWDEVAIAWLYGPRPAGTPPQRALEAAIAAAEARGRSVPPYLSDDDARPAGAAHPLANLWDTHSDPVDDLLHALAVRELALSRFGADRIAAGRPLALLEEVLVPVYLHHRYALDAAAKVLGGVLYEHGLAGDGRPAPRPADADWQRRALSAVLSCLDPSRLDLPDHVLAVLPPRPPDHERSPEQLAGLTSPTFDPLSAAAAAAGLVVDALLAPERCARLVDQSRRDPELPSLHEVLIALLDGTFDVSLRGLRGETGALGPPRLAAVRQLVQRVVTDGLLQRARQPDLAPGVRAAIEAALAALASDLREVLRDAGGEPLDLYREPYASDDARREEAAHLSLLLADIERHVARQRQDADVAPAALPAPPGSPIGTGAPGDASRRGRLPRPGSLPNALRTAVPPGHLGDPCGHGP